MIERDAYKKTGIKQIRTWIFRKLIIFNGTQEGFAVKRIYRIYKIIVLLRKTIQIAKNPVNSTNSFNPCSKIIQSSLIPVQFCLSVYFTG